MRNTAAGACSRARSSGAEGDPAPEDGRLNDLKERERERGKEGRKKKNGAVTSSVHLVIIVVVAEGAAIIDSITNQQSEALLRIQDGGRTKNISLK